MTAKLYVIGHPVAHSLSPKIHRAFGAACGVDLTYETRDFEPGTFAVGAAALREGGALGTNVTVPFKLDALQYALDEGGTVTQRARLAGAANTLHWTKEGVRADNTDGIGFVRDLTERFGFSLAGSRVLILGAGGATRGLLAYLTGCGCGSITVANRTEGKAQDLTKIFPAVQASTLADLAPQYDLIVNSTSASITGEAPAVPGAVYRAASAAYDLFYAARPTPFMRAATAGGVPLVIDGLGMLVEQAAESFAFWFDGIRPDTQSVFEELRRGLNEA